MIEEEIWIPIKGYEGFYEVSHFGRIRRISSYRNKKIGDIGFMSKDRLRVHLTVGKKRKMRFVHQLVLEAFNGERPEGLIACHSDGNPLNNYIGNLRWDTLSSNAQDSIKHGTFIKPKGESHWMGKLKVNDVLAIKKLLKGKTRQHIIAKMFGVCQTTISEINQNKIWSHVA